MVEDPGHGPAAMSFRRHLLLQCHNSPLSGHQGRDKTNHELGKDWWWPGMYEEVCDYCAHCRQCLSEKGLSGVSAWTRTELYSRPFRVLHLDTAKTKNDGAPHNTQHLLTVVCCFPMVLVVQRRMSAEKPNCIDHVERINERSFQLLLLLDRGGESSACDG